MNFNDIPEGRSLLTYIRHDCFMLSTACCNIIFDYFDGAASTAGNILASLDTGRPLYVLVSHHHKDHFSKEIFGWRHRFPNIHFILSKDVARCVRYMLRDDSIYSGERVPQECFTVLRPGEEFNDGTLRVEAFASTDIGNSYALSIGQRCFFHAGDLNAWIWKDESSRAEVAAAIRDYERIEETIAAKYPRFDLAMFPVDSRIGRDYWEGAARFVRRIDVARFVPMHFELADSAEKLSIRHRDALDFPAYANPLRGDYIGLTAPFDCLLF